MNAELITAKDFKNDELFDLGQLPWRDLEIITTPAIIEELDELLYTNWNEKFHPIWCNLHNYQYLSFIVK